jgi:ADP-L-glycero-D-manno-heptose 6-epimerase
MLWRLCSEHRVRLIYASSAATYGDGGAGFDDDHTIEGLARLRPLNAYGWSKHLFDRRAARLARNPDTRPPQCVGLKFFNVYGPNEYHKGAMQSVIAQKFPLARDGEPVTLFKSLHADYPDGGQMRDFVYVRDCVDVMLWLYEHSEVNGLFNMGTGRARSFDDLAAALFAALGTEGEVAYIDLPESIRGRYQYFTQADMNRLRNAGYMGTFASLEEGVADYVRSYLMAEDPYR